MKGIAHFITGVAIATFFPQVVQQGAQGGLLPVWGGVAGILPDTLDFKFARYFESYDDEIDPDPHHPDPHKIAARVAQAMRQAYESNEPRNIMLHTIRLGADLWRQYSLRFNPEAGEIVVRIGPLVNTGQVPYPGSTPEQNEARVQVGVPMVHTYDAENKIDIFSGPSFLFERRGDNLYVSFLDWHRRWSHSLTLAGLLGLAAGLLLGRWAGLVVGLGFAGHVLEDQLGHMGSNLFWPLTRRRMSGLHLLRSGDAIPNFLTVWTALALILFNLDRFSDTPRLAPLPYLLLSLGLPWLVLGGLYLYRRLRRAPEPREKLRQGDILAEAEEIELG
ncbi:MAG: metal-dependent hydrolase [Chloroflexia bacterium]|nr:metal-dependent hydrolase [Chloroflexia bacterium]